ncbi:MAG: hypothetical protein R3F22_02455 [Lysobacteraceae bacterium]
MNAGRNLKKSLMAVAVVAMLASPLALARKKEEPKAEPKYPNATRVEPEVKPSRSVNKQLNKMFELSQEEGKEDDVRRLAEEIIAHGKASNYDKAIANQTLAYQAMDQDDYPGAIQYLQRALDLNALPNDTHFSIMLQVAQMQQAEDQLDAADQTVKRLIEETRSDSPDFVGLRGSIKYQQDDCAGAVPLIKDAMAKSEAKGAKQQSAWPQILIACYADMEQPEEAINVAKQQLAADPENKTLIRNLSTVYLQAEKYGEATALLEDAKNRGLMTEAKDYEQLYRLYHYAEKEDQAIATIDEGLAKGILQPSADAYKIKAEAYYFSDRTAQAIEWYGKAAELSTDGEGYVNQARLLYESDRYAEAKAAANKALERGIKRPGDAWIVIGGAELGMSNKAAGIAAYRKAAAYPETKKAAESWLRASGAM